MKKQIAVLKGDGIGPEVVNEAIKVLNAVANKFQHSFIFEDALIGEAAIEQTGQALPKETIDICKSTDAVLLGAIGDPKYDNDPTATVRPEQGLLSLRKELELFTNVRPVKLHPALSHLSPLKEEKLQAVDLVIYRELTGGIYFGKKEKGEDFASDLCVYHKEEIERVTHLAFKASYKRNKKMCLVDKANVLESSRLWRKVVQDLSKEYQNVEVEYLYIDNAAMQLILNPSRFDVILTSNMFGDILSDEASVLGGSIGLLPSASFGNQYRLYEPVHGSYPQAAGKDVANPMATILSSAIMLRDFGLNEEAQAVENAISKCIESGITTEDINPTNSRKCSEVGEAICNLLAE